MVISILDLEMNLGWPWKIFIISRGLKRTTDSTSESSKTYLWIFPDFFNGYFYTWSWKDLRMTMKNLHNKSRTQTNNGFNIGIITKHTNEFFQIVSMVNSIPDLEMTLGWPWIASRIGQGSKQTTDLNLGTSKAYPWFFSDFFDEYFYTWPWIDLGTTLKNIQNMSRKQTDYGFELGNLKNITVNFFRFFGQIFLYLTLKWPWTWCNEA